MRLVISSMFLLCLSLSPPAKANGMLWSRFSGTQEMDEEGRIAVDNRGSVYIASRTFKVTGEDESTEHHSRIHLIKQAASGRKIWERSFKASFSIHLSDLAVDGRKNVYLLGHFYGRFEGNRTLGECDAALVKLDSNGNKVWVRTFGSTGLDRGRHLAIGKGGAVYVTVSAHGDWEGQARPGHDDILLLKFGPDGSRKWSRFFGTPGVDEANGLALDGQENLYLAETSSAVGTDKTLPPAVGSLIRFDSAGTRNWQVRFDIDSSTVLAGVTAGTQGFISVLGTRTKPPDRSVQAVLGETRNNTFLAIFSAVGARIRTYPLGLGILNALLAADMKGNPSVFGWASDTLARSDPSAGPHYFILPVKLDGTANPIRSRNGTAMETIQDVALDGEGFLYAIGAANEACGGGKGIGEADLCLMKWTLVAPSFDCSEAATLQEKLICGSHTLSALDDSIATLYSSLRKGSANPDELKVEQVVWVKEKRNASTNREQMLRIMRERLESLKSRTGKR